MLRYGFALFVILALLAGASDVHVRAATSSVPEVSDYNPTNKNTLLEKPPFSLIDFDEWYLKGRGSVSQDSRLVQQTLFRYGTFTEAPSGETRTAVLRFVQDVNVVQVGPQVRAALERLTGDGFIAMVLLDFFQRGGVFRPLPTSERVDTLARYVASAPALLFSENETLPSVTLGRPVILIDDSQADLDMTIAHELLHHLFFVSDAGVLSPPFSRGLWGEGNTISHFFIQFIEERFKYLVNTRAGAPPHVPVKRSSQLSDFFASFRKAFDTSLLSVPMVAERAQQFLVAVNSRRTYEILVQELMQPLLTAAAYRHRRVEFRLSATKTLRIDEDPWISSDVITLSEGVVNLSTSDIRRANIKRLFAIPLTTLGDRKRLADFIRQRMRESSTQRKQLRLTKLTLEGGGTLRIFDGNGVGKTRYYDRTTQTGKPDLLLFSEDITTFDSFPLLSGLVSSDRKAEVERFIERFTSNPSMGREKAALNKAQLQDAAHFIAFNVSGTLQALRLGATYAASSCGTTGNGQQRVMDAFADRRFLPYLSAFLKEFSDIHEREPERSVYAASTVIGNKQIAMLEKDCPKETGDVGGKPVNIGLQCPLTPSPVAKASPEPKASALPALPQSIMVDGLNLGQGNAASVTVGLGGPRSGTLPPECTKLRDPLGGILRDGGMGDSALCQLAATFEAKGGAVRLVEDEGDEDIGYIPAIFSGPRIGIPKELDAPSQAEILRNGLVSFALHGKDESVLSGTTSSLVLEREAILELMKGADWLSPQRLQSFGLESYRSALLRRELDFNAPIEQKTDPEMTRSLVEESLGDSLASFDRWDKTRVFRLEPLSCSRQEQSSQRRAVSVEVVTDSAMAAEDVGLDVSEDEEEGEPVTKLTVRTKQLSARSLAVLLLRLRLDPRYEEFGESLLTPLAYLLEYGSGKEGAHPSDSISLEQLKTAAKVATINAAGLQQGLRLDDYMSRSCPFAVRERRGEEFAEFWARFTTELTEKNSEPIVAVAKRVMTKTIEELKDECELVVKPCETDGHNFGVLDNVGKVKCLAHWQDLRTGRACDGELKSLSEREKVCSVTISGPARSGGPFPTPNEGILDGVSANGMLMVDFSELPRLKELVLKNAINVRTIPQPTLESLKSLERLELNYTNVDQGQLALDLPHFKEHLREIVLDRAHPGQLFLDGFEQLVRVVLNESQTAVVTLNNLPKLKAAWIQNSPLRKLKLTKLPQLRAITFTGSKGKGFAVEAADIGTGLAGKSLQAGVNVDLSGSTAISAASQVSNLVSGLGSSKAKATIGLSATTLCTDAARESERRRMYKEVDRVNAERTSQGKGLVELKSCPRPSATGCGDGLIQRPEDCDGKDFAGFSCKDLGFEKGTLKCNLACQFDSIDCVGGGAEELRRRMSVYVCQAPVVGEAKLPSGTEAKLPMGSLASEQYPAGSLASVLPPSATPAVVKPKVVLRSVPCNSTPSKSLSEALKKPEGVCELDLAGQPAPTNLSELSTLQHLKKLNLSTTGLKQLPAEVGELEQLEQLVVHVNNLSAIPQTLGSLKNLKTLSLYRNELTTIPEALGNLEKLEVLYLNDNKLTKLPASIGNLKGLKTFFLTGNALSASEQQRIKKLLPQADIRF